MQLSTNLSLLLLFGLLGLCTSSSAQSVGPQYTHEGVHLSFDRFENLFDASQQRINHAQWKKSLITIDLSQSKKSGLAWVIFQSQVDMIDVPKGTQSAVIDLVAKSVHPLSVWREGVAISPQSDGHFHQLSVPIQVNSAGLRLSPSIKLRYPARLLRSSSGELSGLIPLPPVANADLKVIGRGQAKFIPELNVTSTPNHTQPSLRGAIAVLIPSTESGALLQRKDFQVTLQPSGDGAEIDLELQTLLRGGSLQAWVPISPSSNALIDAKADGKTAITDVRNGWHMVWVEGVGEHIIYAHTRAQIDRSSGQPRLRLSPQSAPRSKLILSLPGERELSTEPSIPVTNRSISNGLSTTKPNNQNETHLITHINADLPPLETILLRWTEKRVTPEEENPEFLSETYQLFELQEGLLKGQAQVELDVIKGELKRLEIEVPAQVVLYHLSGNGVENWITLPQKENMDQSTKRVQVTFGEPRSGESVLSLKWQRVLSKKETLNIPSIRPLNAFQESGVIALFDGDRVGFTPAKADITSQGEERLIPVGQESIPQRILQLKAGEKVSQAFRHVQAPTQLKTSTTTERARELRFDAQLDTLYSLRDGALRAQSQLLLNLKSGRLETLTLQLPSACSEPQVSGPSINRVEPLKTTEGDDPSFKRYQIRFTRRLEGAITLNIDAEQLIPSESTQVSFPRLVVEGAEITQGHIGLTAEAGLEVSPQKANELRRVTIDELPRAVALRSATEVLYGYRYSRNWSLESRLKRHKIIDTLNAEITTSQLESFLLESGQRVDLAKYTISNRDRRDLKLTLPPQSTIQEVLINGSPVRARAEGKQISIPLPKNQQFSLMLRYEVGRNHNHLHRYQLIAPSSDVRTTNISWELFFAPQYQLWSWDGALKKIDSYPTLIDPKHSFNSLKHQATFSYDLLPPNHKSLQMTISLRGVISDHMMRRLTGLSFIALLLIGLKQGFRIAGRSLSGLKYPELGSVVVLSMNLIVSLYQSALEETERMFFFALKTLLLMGLTSWLVIKIYDGIIRFIAYRSAGTAAPLNQDLSAEDDLRPATEHQDQIKTDRPEVSS